MFKSSQNAPAVRVMQQLRIASSNPERPPGRFKISSIPDDSPGFHDRMFTAICHHWMQDAPEDRPGGATWYIAELLSGAWTIMFPCSGPIEASHLLENPHEIEARIAAELKKWGDSRYRESVERSNKLRGSRVSDKPLVTDDDGDDFPVEELPPMPQARRRTSLSTGPTTYDHGKELASEVRRQMEEGGDANE